LGLAVTDRGRRRQLLLSRPAGLALVSFGVLILATAVFVPIPAFEDLEPRPGILLEAVRERYSPCRSGDCTRTMATVRHADGVTRYHFADADTATVEVGQPITVWTYPEFRGFDRVRAWHAEQGGRVIRDHERLSKADRRLRIALLALAPFLFLGGGWIVRHRDWRGRAL
jgi:hypothetical protein